MFHCCVFCFFFSSRRRQTRYWRDWSSDVCSSDLDEAMNGNNAREVLETGRFAPFYPENGGREGLYINVSTLFLRFLGNQAWVLRLPAAIFGILTVWGVYLLAAELYSPPVGLLASFFLATSFWHITLRSEE